MTLLKGDQLVAEAAAYTTQETNIHTRGGIRNHDTRNQAAADPYFRRLDHHNLLFVAFLYVIIGLKNNK